jgi:transposase InsO family protein
MIEVSPSTVYYLPKVRREDRERQDVDLRDKIEAIHLTMPEAGYRTLRHYLVRDHKLTVNWKKIRRIQKKFSLFSEVKRAFVITTDSDHRYPVYENLIRNWRPIVPNAVWVADITYIRIQTGFLYLAVVMDLASRKIIGWAISRRIDEELSCEALQMAIKSRGVESKLIHHSDRGVQYMSDKYCQILNEHGIRPSCSAKGNPYDNAAMERWMRILKQEEVYLRHYETIEDVLATLPNFIEQVYNKKRVHSALGYLTPEEFEQKYWERQQTIGHSDLS